MKVACRSWANLGGSLSLQPNSAARNDTVKAIFSALLTWRSPDKRVLRFAPRDENYSGEFPTKKVLTSSSLGSQTA